MIGRISGILLEKTPPQLLVDCNGVGYEIDVPMSTYYNLPHTGERVVLFTHLAIREDAHLLFGFGTLVGLFPFHSWAPKGYGCAPAATSCSRAATERAPAAPGSTSRSSRRSPGTRRALPVRRGLRPQVLRHPRRLRRVVPR